MSSPDWVQVGVEGRMEGTVYFVFSCPMARGNTLLWNLAVKSAVGLCKESVVGGRCHS